MSKSQKLEKKLLYEKDRAQLFLDTVNVVIVALNAEGNILQLNKKGQQLLGYDADAAIGLSWVETFVPENERDYVRATINNNIHEKNDPPEPYEHTVIAEGGEEHNFEWRNSLFYDDEVENICLLSRT